MKSPSREDAKKQAVVFRALGHPARLRIVHLLAQGPRYVGELAQDVRLSYASVSRHLGVLKTAGVLKDEYRGLRVYYAIALSAAVDLAAHLDQAMLRGRD